jgi:PmbA protein
VPTTALDLVDEEVAAGFDKDAAEALLRRSDAVLRGHAQAISATSTWSQSTGTWATVTSDGLAVTERSTSAWLGAEVTLKDAGDARPEEWDWRGGRQRSALPAPELLAESALRMAVARLGAKKGPSQRTRLIVSPRAAGNLIGHLLRPASAAAVQQGKSFLAGKVGQPLFSPQLSLVDDPLLPRGLASRRVDGEGIAAARLPIIEGGVLRAIYVDTYYGSKAGLKTTTGSLEQPRLRPGQR